MSKIAWVIDFPINGSGGHKTWFYYINELVKQGNQVDVYIKPQYQLTNKELTKLVSKYLIPTKANLILSWSIEGEYDMLFATWYKTAKLVAEYPHAKYKLYFVQDFEPWFNPVGDEYLEAMNSYSLGLFCITMSNFLAVKLSKEFNSKCYPLFLGADTNVYNLHRRKRRNQICFIYQSDKPRRCPQLGTEALRIVTRLRPDINIVSYGCNERPYLTNVDHRGLLHFSKLNRLYNESALGLCLSSTNPSRVPFEMMASGLPVVELYGENNIYDFPDDCIALSKPDPMSLASTILNLLDSPTQLEKTRQNGLDFMNTHSIKQSIESFMNFIGNIDSHYYEASPNLFPIYTNAEKFETEKYEEQYKPLKNEESYLNKYQKHIYPIYPTLHYSGNKAASLVYSILNFLKKFSFKMKFAYVDSLLIFEISKLKYFIKKFFIFALSFKQTLTNRISKPLLTQLKETFSEIIQEDIERRITKHYLWESVVFPDLLSKIKPPRELTMKQRRLFKEGVKYSLLFTAPTLYSMNFANENSISKIFYLTREGEFFKKIHDTIVSANKTAIKYPESEILEVSRKSTYATTLEAPIFDSLKSLWSQYPNQSIADLFYTLNIDISQFEKILANHRIESNKTIDNIQEDSRIKSLFEDNKFISQLKSEILKKKENFLAYLKSKGIQNITCENNQLQIFDIGWHGTMQNNIAKLIPKKIVHGFYMGILKPSSFQEENTRKHSFGPNIYTDDIYTIELLYDHEAVLEMLTNNQNGSVVDYKITTEGVTAVRENSKKEDDIYENYTRYFQMGVISSIPELLNIINEKQIPLNEIRSYNILMLKHLLTYPDKSIAEAFFKLSHNESFGVGSFIDLSKNSKVSLLHKVLFWIPSVRRKIYLQAKKSRWKEGFYKNNGLSFIAKLIQYFA
jgi:hypothetical protein